MLWHTYPRVRKAVAESLYVKLLTLEDASFAPPPPPALVESTADAATQSSSSLSVDTDAAMTVLADTVWDGAVPAARRQRALLYGMFGIEPSKELALAESAAESAGSDAAARGRGAGVGDEEDGTYGALVREMGY